MARILALVLGVGLLAGCVGPRISQQELDERSVAIICDYDTTGTTAEGVRWTRRAPSTAEREACRYRVLYGPKVPGPSVVCTTTSDGVTQCVW